MLKHHVSMPVYGPYKKIQETFSCNNIPGSIFQKDLDEAYEQIVCLHKNLFMLPSGAAGKRFINEINRLWNLWANESLLNNVAIKAMNARFTSTKA